MEPLAKLTRPPHQKPRAGNKPLKKIAFLTLCVVVAIIVDGSMSYEIFNTHPDTLIGWLLASITFILVVVIWLADASKKNDHQDN